MNKITSIQEALRALNESEQTRVSTKRTIKEAVEDTPICEKCGKTPCECEKQEVSEEVMEEAHTFIDDEGDEVVAEFKLEGCNKNESCGDEIGEGILGAVGDVVGGAIDGVKNLLASDEGEKAVEEGCATEACDEGCEEELTEANTFIDDEGDEVVAGFRLDTMESLLVNYIKKNKLSESLNRNGSLVVLTEDLANGLPDALGEDEIINFIDQLPTGVKKLDENGNEVGFIKLPRFFKMGYAKQIATRPEFDATNTKMGAKKREKDPSIKTVQIFKLEEFSRLYSKVEYRSQKAVQAQDKDTDAQLGAGAADAMHTGEKTGFQYNTGNENLVNAIGSYADGSKALQAFMPQKKDGSEFVCQTKVSYYISVEGAPATLASKEDVAQYLTPANAANLTNPKPAATYTNAAGDEKLVQHPMRFKLAGIYMIGDLGSSFVK